MSTEHKLKSYRLAFRKKYLKLIESTKSLIQAFSARSKSPSTTRHKTSSRIKSMQWKRWPAFSCHYIKDTVLPKTSRRASPSSHEDMATIPVRAVMRVLLPSDSDAAQVVSMAKNFDGVKKAEKWSGGKGLVVVGTLDTGKLETWIEAVTGLDTKVVLVSAKLAAMKEGWFKFMLQSAAANKLRLVVLGLKGVEDVSLTPLGNSMHFLRVKGDIQYSKLLSVIEVVHTFYYQPPVSADQCDDQSALDMEPPTKEENYQSS